jgi:hypothetical protein
MESFLPDPRHAYETLAEALLVFRDHQDHPTAHAITELHAAVDRVTEAWQRCEAQRATQEKEFRYHVVRLKILLAGAYQTLEALSDAHLPTKAGSPPVRDPVCPLETESREKLGMKKDLPTGRRGGLVLYSSS